MKPLRTALVAGVLLATTAAGQSGFKSWPLSQAPSELRPIISRADVVIVAMQGAVLRELSDALTRGGTVGALSFCHLDATAVTQRVSESEGIAAGRTSDRLRNPTNAPKSWATPLIQAHAGQRAKDVEGYVVDLGEKIGVLRPIAERQMCAGCHGPQESLAPGVKLALQRRYPDDRAVGFNEGEIRGWFWVEMPKRVR
jgi:hypothetical protein